MNPEVDGIYRRDSGLNLENMNDYLALPTVAAIGGSWIATRQQIACGEWNTITRQAEETLSRAA